MILRDWEMGYLIIDESNGNEYILPKCGICTNCGSLCKKCKADDP